MNYRQFLAGRENQVGGPVSPVALVLSGLWFAVVDGPEWYCRHVAEDRRIDPTDDQVFEYQQAISMPRVTMFERDGVRFYGTEKACNLGKPLG